MGWTPRFQMDASTMFHIQNIRHLLVALHFSFGDGNVEDHAHFYGP
ncbi:hypothetical protein [Acetobacter estunensis]|nr:hypothetical protein [Acetobacter estunensis]MBV1835717.1 hypothetical protein [Acetobacter estunensis]MBV1836022.1 hypothetical protein [Acetobacter estunensis]